MTRRIIDPNLIRQLKDGPDKQAEVEVVREDSPDPSIDSMLKRGLENLDRLMRVITKDLSTGSPSRETVMNLKDAMSMLQTLKEREEEILEEMTDEELDIHDHLQRR